MDDDTLLLRQAHPNFMDGEVITSQIFVPFPKDDGKLSVDDGDQINAHDAYKFYTEDRGNTSDSVWAVNKSESDACNVPGIADPAEDAPWHAALDFGGKTVKQCRKIAKKLKKYALVRGCQYRPTD